MSQLNGFNASIPEAQEETTDGYVVMRHGNTFRLRLHNSHKHDGQCKPCDAEVYLNGKSVGVWRIPYGQTVYLERGVSDSGKFTAYKNGSQEAQQIGLDANDPDNGLIKVIFKPGSKQCRPVVVQPVPIIVQPYTPYYPQPWLTGPTYVNLCKTTYSDNTSCNVASTSSTIFGAVARGSANACSYQSENLSGGGIGLSGSSSQTFTDTDALDYDEASTCIYLRLAFQNEEPRPVQTKVYVASTNVPRPLK